MVAVVSSLLHRLWTGIVGAVAAVAIVLVISIIGIVPIAALESVMLVFGVVGFVLGALLGKRKPAPKSENETSIWID
jgi:hypothetical protein